MGDIKTFILFCLLSWSLSFDSSLAEYSAEDCAALGFYKPEVTCSSCEKLSDFGLDEIKNICKECCQKDVANKIISERYPKAVLEVCTCKFGAYPQIQAFVKSQPTKRFPNLQIKYLRGLDPTVKMMNKDGEVQETLSINKWDTNTIEEFFETHLTDAKFTD